MIREEVFASRRARLLQWAIKENRLKWESDSYFLITEAKHYEAKIEKVGENIHVTIQIDAQKIAGKIDPDGYNKIVKMLIYVFEPSGKISKFQSDICGKNWLDSGIDSPGIIGIPQEKKGFDGKKVRFKPLWEENAFLSDFFRLVGKARGNPKSWLMDTVLGGEFKTAGKITERGA